MANNQHLLRTIDQLLSRETLVYKRYVEILQQERRAVVNFSRVEVERLAAERERLIESMQKAAAEREQLVRDTLGLPKPRRGEIQKLPTLREFIRTNFPQKEAKPLILKAEHIRALAETCREHTRSFGQVLAFSMNLVNGLKTILWSATQSAVQSYAPSGKPETRYTQARGSGVISKA